MDRYHLPDSGTANGLKNGRRMRKLCQKEEFLNNIEILNFSKKKLKKEYSTEYSLEYSIWAANSKLPRGRLEGRHMAQDDVSERVWAHFKILVAVRFDPMTSRSTTKHLTVGPIRWFVFG